MYICIYVHVHVHVHIYINHLYIYICRRRSSFRGSRFDWQLLIWDLERKHKKHLHVAKGDSQNTEMSSSIRVNRYNHETQSGNEKPAQLRANTKPDWRLAEMTHVLSWSYPWCVERRPPANCHAMGVPSSILPTNYPLLCMPTVFKAITNTYGINIKIYIMSIYHCLSLFISTFLYLSLSIIIYRET